MLWRGDLNPQISYNILLPGTAKIQSTIPVLQADVNIKSQQSVKQQMAKRKYLCTYIQLPTFMTEPAGCVTAQAHAVFGGYLPLAATGLVSTSTGPETGPPQLNVEYCNMKSTMPLGP